ncbi:hypothetical protein HPB52_010325 [Rhipicephalus sanguineus]|uniref:Uncharacterized protein n=1 Tax=Rhipicephalus sanguineus TaxID=34632 RepID=A0A9D4PTQ2_RHISA|nr:hypothetical protein HPB52_010325 [Rhipicephalus sanguineus]
MEPSEVISERDPLLPNEPCVASIATPPRSLGKNKSGHILNSDSRNMIFHCYTYWCNREPERSVEDASKFVADMLGVGERTVLRMTCAKFDSFTLCALRSWAHDFFRRNEMPTVEKITGVLGALLAEIGFKREKRSRNSLLIGRDDITDWRNRFLRDSGVGNYDSAVGGRFAIFLATVP